MKKVFFFLLLMTPLRVTYAQELTKAEIYKRGTSHLANKNYVDALKYLFAYKCMTEKELLESDPKVLGTLNSNIQLCEQEIRLRMRHPSASIRSSFLDVKSLTLDYLKEFSKEDQMTLIEGQILMLKKEQEKLGKEN